jgi:hypothetical protein
LGLRILFFLSKPAIMRSTALVNRSFGGAAELRPTTLDYRFLTELPGND